MGNSLVAVNCEPYHAQSIMTNLSIPLKRAQNTTSEEKSINFILYDGGV